MNVGDGGGPGAPPNTGSTPPGGSAPPASTTPDPTSTSVYQAASADANAAYQNALNAIAKERSLAYQTYGFNPDGTLSNNPYGLYQQAMTQDDWQQQQYNTDWQRLQQDNARDVGRENTNFAQLLADLTTARTRDQRDAGLNAVFDALMNPKALHMDVSNDHSQFADLLRGEANAEKSAADNAVARGLGGGKGLARQGVTDAAFAAAGERQNFKQKLIDALTDIATEQKKDTTAHNYVLQDLATQLSRGQQDYNTNTAHLKYKRGLDQYNVTQALKQALAGYDEQASQASMDYQSQLTNALLASIQYLASTDPGTPSTPTAPSPSSPAPAAPAPKKAPAKKKAPAPPQGGMGHK